MTETRKIKGRTIKVVRTDLPAKPPTERNGRLRIALPPKQKQIERDYRIAGQFQNVGMTERHLETGGMTQRRRQKDKTG